jgi:polyisoprenoid-binding protein YceI
MKMFVKPLIAATLGFALMSAPAFAAPVAYKIDSSHTSVVFNYAHAGGLSHMNGKFMNAVGTVTLDEAAPANSKLEVSFDINGVNTGVPALDAHLKTADFFDAAQFPTATFKSTKVEVTGKDTAKVTGDLTLHGVTKPVPLKINSFKCITHPMLKREVCGADASAELNRSDFGVDYGVNMTGSPMVKLAIQVEAIRND